MFIFKFLYFMRCFVHILYMMMFYGVFCDVCVIYR